MANLLGIHAYVALLLPKQICAFPSCMHACMHAHIHARIVDTGRVADEIQDLLALRGKHADDEMHNGWLACTYGFLSILQGVDSLACLASCLVSAHAFMHGMVVSRQGITSNQHIHSLLHQRGTSVAPAFRSPSSIIGTWPGSGMLSIHACTSDLLSI